MHICHLIPFSPQRKHVQVNTDVPERVPASAFPAAGRGGNQEMRGDKDKKSV